MCILPGTDLELAGALCFFDIKPELRHALQALLTMAWIDDVKRFLPPFESLLGEREQHAILLLPAVKESTGVTGAVEFHAG
jgi:hypothetical protein